MSTLVSHVFVLHTRFRLCGRHFRTVDAILPISGTFSLGKRVFAFAWDVFPLKPFMTIKVRRFGTVYAFSPLRVTVSLEKSVFAFAGNVFVL